jgi:hypothetical protein
MVMLSQQLSFQSYGKNIDKVLNGDRIDIQPACFNKLKYSTM